MCTSAKMTVSMYKALSQGPLRRLGLFILICRSITFLFIACLILLILTQRVILADSVSFAEYAKNYMTISCATVEEYDAAIEHVQLLIKQKDLYYARPEKLWIQQLLVGQKLYEESTPTNLAWIGSSDAATTLEFFRLNEEKSKACLIKTLDEAIAEKKFVNLCTTFKKFVMEHQPPISYYVIEEFFQKHLTQNDISPQEKLFNKQLHNLYLRKLHAYLIDFETKFRIEKNTITDEMTKIYINSWRLQTRHSLPWDLAFQMATKQYLIDMILYNLFSEKVIAVFFYSSSKEAYKKDLLTVGEVFIQVYAYLEDYNTLQDALTILRYRRDTCLAMCKVPK
jgi:hypothetical protein